MSNSQAPRLYEGMFLVDANRASQDWGGVVQHIREVIVRHGGRIEDVMTRDGGKEKKSDFVKWDDRKLAYPVNGHSRGIFLLVHFHAIPSRIRAMQTSYELSEVVLRALLIQDEDGIVAEVRSLPDEPTDPVRFTRRGRRSGGRDNAGGRDAARGDADPADADSIPDGDAEDPAEETPEK